MNSNVQEEEEEEEEGGWGGEIMTRLGTRERGTKERVIEKFLVCAIDALSFHYSTRLFPTGSVRPFFHVLKRETATRAARSDYTEFDNL